MASLSDTSFSETEQAIFDSALGVFARKGKDGARMQEIADGVGINKAMLHYYFRSKDALYEAVFMHVAAQMFSAMDEVLAKDLPLKEALPLLVDVHMDKHVQHPELSRLWVQENLNGAPVARKIIGGLMAAEVPSGPTRLVARIREAVASNEIPPIDPVQFLVTMLGMIIMPFIAFPTVSVLDPDLANDPDSFLTQRKQHIIEVLSHGVFAR